MTCKGLLQRRRIADAIESIHLDPSHFFQYKRCEDASDLRSLWQFNVAVLLQGVPLGILLDVATLSFQVPSRAAMARVQR